MTLFRATGISCRLHGSEVSKSFQRGATSGIISILAPATVVHTWVEVLYNDKWIALEGVITDEAYLKAVREKYSDIYTSPSFNEAFTEADIKKICRAVETETYCADFISKSHVAEVIYARLDDKNFPDTVNKVVVRGQFAFGRSKISPDTRLAVEYAYYFPSEVHGALYFHNGGKKEAKTSWHGQTYITTDDVGHNFYGNKGW